ncbi:hypothetical protein BEQ56_05490 [Anaerolineaceae bacterium oral taxon 439]|nr:hypothetical protein BEQ56_05490 [Anaerolineaceae bacterium oral taxon 439]
MHSLLSLRPSSSPGSSEEAESPPPAVTLISLYRTQPPGICTGFTNAGNARIQSILFSYNSYEFE